MSIMMKCHLKAFSNAIEQLTIAGALGLIANVLWMAHDIIHNGVSTTYVCLLIGLVSATAMTIHAGVRHHIENVKCERDWHMKYKLMVQRSKIKHGKHLEVVK